MSLKWFALLSQIIPRKEKRQYKKRKHKSLTHNHVGGYSAGGIEGIGVLSSDEEPLTQPSADAEESEDEGQFAFRRNKLCTYHMVGLKLHFFVAYSAILLSKL